jgi:hypothetical protein
MTKSSSPSGASSDGLRTSAAPGHWMLQTVATTALPGFVLTQRSDGVTEVRQTSFDKMVRIFAWGGRLFVGYGVVFGIVELFRTFNLLLSGAMMLSGGLMLLLERAMRNTRLELHPDRWSLYSGLWTPTLQAGVNVADIAALHVEVAPANTDDGLVVWNLVAERCDGTRVALATAVQDEQIGALRAHLEQLRQTAVHARDPR